MLHPTLERSPLPTSRTYSVRPPVATRSASPVASCTSRAWRPLQSPYCDPRRLDYADAARPGRPRDPNRDCLSNPKAIPIWTLRVRHGDPR